MKKFLYIVIIIFAALIFTAIFAVSPAAKVFIKNSDTYANEQDARLALLIENAALLPQTIYNKDNDSLIKKQTLEIDLQNTRAICYTLKSDSKRLSDLAQNKNYNQKTIQNKFYKSANMPAVLIFKKNKEIIPLAFSSKHIKFLEQTSFSDTQDGYARCAQKDYFKIKIQNDETNPKQNTITFE